MTTCTQPGCTGSIVDGYCDICGSPGSDDTPSVPTGVSPPPSARVQPSLSPGAPSGFAPPTSSLPGACTQPGCTGRIVDGYCDVCGSPGAESGAGPGGGSAHTPPVGSDPLSSGPPSSGPLSSGPLSSGAVTSSSRTSSRLDSAALGSKIGRAHV